MVRVVEEEGLHLDLATGGELAVARRGGFPADRIVFHGNNKSVDELRDALDAGVGRIVVDSSEELDRLERLAIADGVRPRVHIRVTPGVEAHTHEYIETGIEDSKFGFPVRPGDALEAARRVAASPHLELAGLHCHIGSQIHVLQSYALAAAVVVGLAAEVDAAAGPGSVRELNLGGGLGIAYHDGDEPPTVAEYAAVLRRSLHEAVAAAALTH